MPSRRWPRGNPTADAFKRSLVMLSLLLIAACLFTVGLLFRNLVTELAVSDARDLVIATVNTIVKTIMQDDAFLADELVVLQKDGAGNVTAVTTNVAAVNTLSAEVLERAVSLTEESVITVDIPLGNLTGSALLLNKGPNIPVNVIMLSSSAGGFRSELTGAGINQTRHQILLDLNMELTLLMPWRAIDTSVSTEILVSETVIVGEVPESYLSWEK